MGNEQSAMQLSEVNPADFKQRQAYLMACIHQMGGNYANKAMEERYFAYKLVCEKLQERGVVEVGNMYFEYQVDSVAWKNLFRRLRDQAPPWPFEGKSPKLDDMSEDVSPSYKQWRINRNLPVDTHQAETTDSTN